MEIKKGDILYNWELVSIGKEMLDCPVGKFRCADDPIIEGVEECPDYTKCWRRPQKLKMVKWIVSSIQTRKHKFYSMYSTKKAYLERITTSETFKSKIEYSLEGYKNGEIILEKPFPFSDYGKSEAGAKIKAIAELKKTIKEMKAGNKNFRLEALNIKSYELLLKRLTKK